MGVRRKILGIGCWIMSVNVGAYAQGVSIGLSSAGLPQASALLDLDVSGGGEKKGLLIPRMTFSEMTNIPSPATSLLVYSTDATMGFHYFDGTDWALLSADNLGNHKATNNITIDGYWLSGTGGNDGIKVTTSNEVGIGETNPQAKLHVDGTVRLEDLSGTGTRMVVANTDGDLSTQSIPSGGPGVGATLNVTLTSHTTDIDVAGVSYMYMNTTGNYDVKGLVGGVTNQIIYLINQGTVDDIKFKDDEGTQEFLKDLDLKKEEGAIIMFDGNNWIILSKH